MRLKEYLKLNKISSKEFANTIGISPVSLSRYINGERIPEKDIFFKIFEKTNGFVSPNDFYFIKKEEPELTQEELRLIKDMSKELKNGSKKALAKTITLVESTLKKDKLLVQKIFENFKINNNSIRIGITGVPGVGKSTFIESLGLFLIKNGFKVAVLAIDPSSKESGGSILGDKTRMEKLSVNPSAFIRPSPSDGHLGGVAKKTHESILCLEEAGFNVIFIETMGVGQAETAVYDMVDIFLVLLLPAGGDELQGIKKGIIELADLIIVNKADNDLKKTAEITQREYKNALSITGKPRQNHFIDVLMCSSLKSQGLEEIWSFVTNFIKKQKKTKNFYESRESQKIKWMWSTVNNTINQIISKDITKNKFVIEIQEKVRNKSLSIFKASQLLIDFLIKNKF